MDVSTPAKQGQSNFAIVIDLLRTKHKQRNAAAVDMLHRLGTDCVPLLVDEAIKCGRHAHHRMRILDVIAGIGEPLSAADYHELSWLQEHSAPRVREKASEVLNLLNPDGRPPLTAEEIRDEVMELFRPGQATRRAIERGKQQAIRQGARPCSRH